MIFVTGGTGMVGAHLLYDLVSKGEKVRALRRPKSDIQRTEKIFSYYSTSYQSLMQNIEWVEGDLLDKDGLFEVLKGIDQIYHAAAIVSFDPKDRDIMIHNNYQGTANLADLALSLNISRFCYVSSIAAIGSPPEGIEANEDHPWRNMDHSAYAESKYLSEMEVWRTILQGLDAVIVNPSIILGPGNWKTGSSSLFNRVWKGIKFYTKGVTGFVDVKDVTAAMLCLMDEKNWNNVKNQRYILNAENISFHQFLTKVAKALNRKAPKFYANETLLNLAWRFSAIKSFLTRTRPSITHETARSANKLSFYDGSKICRAIGFEYTPVEVSIDKISRIFLRDMGLK
jgi:dihydroflavonol-4-reductase